MASVHDWLEGVKAGYGGKFAAAFAEVGAEDAADIADLIEFEISSIEALLLRAGAKQLHVKKIREAIAREVGGSFVSREASADAHDGSSTLRRKGSSAFAKSVPRRSSIVDAEVRQQGYLDKASSGAFRQHQSRYFVAAGHYLKYYESSERCGPDDDVKGCLDLRDVLSIEADGKTLTIVCGGGGKALELVARSSENAAVWKEAIEAGRAADTDSYGRKYSARPAPPAAAVAAGAAQLVTREEAVQQIEAALGQPVLRARLKLVQQAFTWAGGGVEARNLDLAAVQRSGFDNYLTDTVSRRFRAGQAVLLASPDGKTPAALGKPHGVPPCSVLPSFAVVLAH